MGTPSVPVSLGELRNRVLNITRQTATYSGDEVRDAVNHGYQRLLRAIRAVRPQQHLSYVDNFTLVNGQSEFDISRVSPPIWRITKLIVPRLPAERISNSSLHIAFEYRDMRDPDFEDRERAVAGASDRIVYDILRGRLPVPNEDQDFTATIASYGGNGDTAILTGLPSGVEPYVGQELQIVGAGAQRMIEGDGVEPTTLMPTDYFGRVTSWAPGTSTVGLSPRVSDVATTGAGVVLYRRRVLKTAPAMARDLTGRLFYLYLPLRLVKDSDTVDDIASEHADAIVAYAAGWLLRSTNDAMSDRWMLEGQEMRSEMMQDIEPLSGENTEALATGLGGLGDW